MSDETVRGATDVNIQDFVAIVSGMSRFLTRLASLPPFQEAGVGLAEWSALSVIADKKDINNRQLANVLGISAQRVNQITDSLKASANITVHASPEDARKKIISITPSGMARLRELNAQLQPIIATALGKRPKILSGSNRTINRVLMRITVPPKSIERKPVKTAAPQGRAAQGKI